VADARTQTLHEASLEMWITLRSLAAAVVGQVARLPVFTDRYRQRIRDGLFLFCTETSGLEDELEDLQRQINELYREEVDGG
jgi:hypothetical protein